MNPLTPFSPCLQCDETLPACSQCANSKRQCPGYIARFDLILRDQTKSVRRKAQQKKQTRSSPHQSDVDDSRSGSKDALAYSNKTSSSSAIKRSTSADRNLPGSRMLNDFPEQQAICAFFLDFVLLPRHPDSVRGHLEHLLPLYSTASPDSPLSLATSSVALVMSEGSRVRQSNQQLGRSIFGRALRKTSAAIRDPVESVKDETLMAVLLLGLFEVSPLITALCQCFVSLRSLCQFVLRWFLYWHFEKYILMYCSDTTPPI